MTNLRCGIRSGAGSRLPQELQLQVHFLPPIPRGSMWGRVVLLGSSKALGQLERGATGRMLGRRANAGHARQGERGYLLG